MKLAYLIIAHKNPEQLQRLFRILYHPENFYVFHLDAKSSPEFQKTVRSFLDQFSNVHLLESENCRWGGFSMVHIELAAIEYLLRWNHQWDFFINLSGQDFPLKTQNQIISYLKKHAEKNFITVFDQTFIDSWCNPYLFFRPAASDPDFLNAQSRVERYYVEVPGISQLLYIPFFKRRFMPGLTWHAGWQWMILNRKFCEYIFTPGIVEPYIRFFKNTFIPDEGFFQTLIMNSPFKETIVNDYKRTVNWQHRGDVNIYRSEDYDFLTESHGLFARKFDQNIDSDIISRLEKRLMDSQLTGSQI